MISAHAADLVNGLVESVGAIFTWRNALAYQRVRRLEGVYWPTTAFFTLWGLWNLAYYPALSQWASFAGGVMLVLGNAAWVIMVLTDKLVTD